MIDCIVTGVFVTVMIALGVLLVGSTGLLGWLIVALVVAPVTVGFLFH